nr:hydroxyacylglutathione hydrolase family protein [Bacteriovorax sp. HI3]
MKPMKVQQIFFKNTLRNFCYIITFSDGAIYCIDPFNASEVKDFLGEGKKLAGIINTHDHCDHYSGNEELLKAYPCPVYAHEKANIPGKTKDLVDGDVVYQNGDWSLEAVFTPGHTMSHICLMLKEKGVPHALFTGDCFFNAGVGNCHNGGNPEVLYETISGIFSQYPDELLIYPGHEYLKRNLEFTLNIEVSNKNAKAYLNKLEGVNLNEVFFINNMKKEREINTFLRLREAEIQKHLQLQGESDKTIFIKLRELRNKW